MRARVIFRARGGDSRSVTEVEASSPDDVWRLAEQDRLPAGRRLRPGDVVYVGDTYFKLNGDGGWRVLAPGAETQRLYQLIVEAS